MDKKDREEGYPAPPSPRSSSFHPHACYDSFRQAYLDVSVAQQVCDSCGVVSSSSKLSSLPSLTGEAEGGEGGKKCRRKEGPQRGWNTSNSTLFPMSPASPIMSSVLAHLSPLQHILNSLTPPPLHEVERLLDQSSSCSSSLAPPPPPAAGAAPSSSSFSSGGAAYGKNLPYYPPPPSASATSFFSLPFWSPAWSEAMASYPKVGYPFPDPNIWMAPGTSTTSATATASRNTSTTSRPDKDNNSGGSGIIPEGEEEKNTLKKKNEEEEGKTSIPPLPLSSSSSPPQQQQRYTVSLSRHNGCYYFKPSTKERLRRSPTYHHPQTHQQYVATPQAFLRDPSISTTLRELVDFAYTQYLLPTHKEESKPAIMLGEGGRRGRKEGREEKEVEGDRPHQWQSRRSTSGGGGQSHDAAASSASLIASSSSSLLSPLETLQQEAKNWFADQRLRHTILDGAVLSKLKITYKHPLYPSSPSPSSSFHSGAPPLSSHLHPPPPPSGALASVQQQYYPPPLLHHPHHLGCTGNANPHYYHPSRPSQSPFQPPPQQPYNHFRHPYPRMYPPPTPLPPPPPALPSHGSGGGTMTMAANAPSFQQGVLPPNAPSSSSASPAGAASSLPTSTEMGKTNTPETVPYPSGGGSGEEVNTNNDHLHPRTGPSGGPVLGSGGNLGMNRILNTLPPPPHLSILDDRLRFLLGVTAHYPPSSTSSCPPVEVPVPFPPLPRGWTGLPSPTYGLYIFRCTSHASSSLSSASVAAPAGGGYLAHPHTRLVYRVSPQALASSRGVKKEQLLGGAHRSPLLSGEASASASTSTTPNNSHHSDSSPSSSREGGQSATCNSAGVSERELQEWWINQQVRHPVFDRVVIQLLKVDYEYGEKQRHRSRLALFGDPTLEIRIKKNDGVERDERTKRGRDEEDEENNSVDDEGEEENDDENGEEGNEQKDDERGTERRNDEQGGKRQRRDEEKKILYQRAAWEKGDVNSEMQGMDRESVDDGRMLQHGQEEERDQVEDENATYSRVAASSPFSPSSSYTNERDGKERRKRRRPEGEENDAKHTHSNKKKDRQEEEEEEEEEVHPHSSSPRDHRHRHRHSSRYRHHRHRESSRSPSSASSASCSSTSSASPHSPGRLDLNKEDGGDAHLYSQGGNGCFRSTSSSASVSSSPHWGRERRRRGGGRGGGGGGGDHYCHSGPPPPPRRGDGGGRYYRYYNNRNNNNENKNKNNYSYSSQQQPPSSYPPSRNFDNRRRRY